MAQKILEQVAESKTKIRDNIVDPTLKMFSSLKSKLSVPAPETKEPSAPLENKQKKALGHYNTLVVAGGNSRSIAALGALHYLWIKNTILYVNNYIGVSSGSILVYLLCIGYTPIEIITYLTQTTFLKNMQAYNIMNIIENRGVLNWTWIQEHLESLTIKKLGRFLTMKDIPILLNRKFVCVTYNETTNQTEYLTAESHPDLPCLTAIRMSCAVPILFDQCQYNHCTYIDGAFGDNFPILHFDDDQNISLGINFVDINPPDHRSVIGYMYHIFMIPITSQAKKNIDASSDRCTVVNLDTSAIVNFEFDLTTQQKLDIVSQGYSAIKAHFEEQNEPVENLFD